jgi:hypothetical protein
LRLCRQRYGSHYDGATVTEISEDDYLRGKSRTDWESRYTQWRQHNPNLVGTSFDTGAKWHDCRAATPKPAQVSFNETRSYVVSLSQDAPFQVSRFADRRSVQATSRQEAIELVANDLTPIPPSQREGLADLWRETWLNDSSVS